MSNKAKARLLIVSLIGLNLGLSLCCLPGGGRTPLPDLVIPENSSIHDIGYDEVWILGVSGENVRAQLIDSKSVIIFKPKEMDLVVFSESQSWVAPVTFICANGSNKDCDLKKPFKLYVSNKEVKFVQMTKATKK